jgi:hypothetical protein
MSDIVKTLIRSNAYEIAEANQTGWSQGVKFEQERILRLAEEHGLSDIVKLIKGETK